MIRGIGVDICQVSRMESISLDSSFAKRFFSLEEQEYLQDKGISFTQSLAGMYAAKEAFAKALGSGVRAFALQEVEVLHSPDGQPYYSISGKALEAQKSRGIERMSLSISVGQGPEKIQ